MVILVPILQILLFLSYLAAGQSSISKIRTMQSSVVDISNYQCMQCLAGNSIYYCNNQDTQEAGCCSGSNFFQDRCTVSLKRSFNCTSYIADSNLRYAQCAFTPSVCGTTQQWLHAGSKAGEVRINGTKGRDGMACSYRVRRDDDSQQVIIRIKEMKGVMIYATKVEGYTAQDQVVNSQEILLTGSYRFFLTPNQTLMLSVVIKDRLQAQATFQYYSIGQEHYEVYMKHLSIILFSSFFAFYLFLVATQRCRIVTDRHQQEIEEYLQRKELYKQFESDEIFRKNSQFEEVHPLKTVENKAIAGYETYFRNERGALKKQSFMMNRVLSNRGALEQDKSSLDQETYQPMQRIQRPNNEGEQLYHTDDLRQSYTSRIQTTNLLNQETGGGPIYQYNDRFSQSNNHPDNLAERLYSQSINRRNRLPTDFSNNGPTFPEHTGHDLLSQNNNTMFQAVDVSQQPHPLSYRDELKYQNREFDQQTYPAPIGSQRENYQFGNKVPNSRLQTILKNHLNM